MPNTSNIQTTAKMILKKSNYFLIFDLKENMNMLGMTAQPTKRKILWNIDVCEFKVIVIFLR